MVNRKAVTYELARKAGLSTKRFPKSEQEVQLVSKVVAEELEHLSIEDHERALFEIHGISQTGQEEDPEMIRRALEELDRELDSIEEKDAYDQAKFMNESYVTSREFRLLFLRSEDFDATTAARTMVYHFDLKRELFGSGDVLAREVFQSDLTPHDLETLQCGILQLLPTRDAAGRFIQAVSCDDPYVGDNPVETLRPFWYTLMSMLRDEELQRYGTIWVVSHLKPVEFQLEYYKEYNRLEVAIPLKVFATHYCRGGNNDLSTAVGFQMFAHETERCRFKIHSGSREEIDFSLQTFGIPAQDIPLNPDNSWSNKAHLIWLEILQNQENDITKARKTIIPKNCDVLFGKNARARDHSGNLRAHLLVEENFEEYEEASKTKKTEIANKIISKIHEIGGRFLKQDKHNQWVEVQGAHARQKIGHWCRHMRHKVHKSRSVSPDHEKNLRAKRVTPSSSPSIEENVKQQKETHQLSYHPLKIVRTN